MARKVKLYNGQIISFPDDTPDDTIRRVARDYTARFRAVEAAEEPSSLDWLPNSIQRGFRSAQQMTTGAEYGLEQLSNKYLGTDFSPMDEMTRMAELQIRSAQAAPPPEQMARREEMQRAVEESLAADGAWSGIGTGISQLAQNPDIALSIMGESLGAYAPTLAGAAIAGGIGGAVVRGLVAGLGSFGLEYSDAYMQTLQEAGVNLQDPVALLEGLQDPAVQEKARELGALRGVPIGVMDAISMGLAGRLFAFTRGMGRGARIAAGSGELATQAAMGGAGEALAQIFSKGEVDDPLGVAAEIVAELGTGPAEIIMGAREAARAKTDQAPPAEGVQPPPAATPSAPTPPPMSDDEKVKWVRENYAQAVRGLPEENIPPDPNMLTREEALTLFERQRMQPGTDFAQYTPEERKVAKTLGVTPEQLRTLSEQFEEGIIDQTQLVEQLKAAAPTKEQIAAAQKLFDNFGVQTKGWSPREVFNAARIVQQQPPARQEDFPTALAEALRAERDVPAEEAAVAEREALRQRSLNVPPAQTPAEEVVGAAQQMRPEAVVKPALNATNAIDAMPMGSKVDPNIVAQDSADGGRPLSMGAVRDYLRGRSDIQERKDGTFVKALKATAQEMDEKARAKMMRTRPELRQLAERLGGHAAAQRVRFVPAKSLPGEARGQTVVEDDKLYADIADQQKDTLVHEMFHILDVSGSLPPSMMRFLDKHLPVLESLVRRAIKKGWNVTERDINEIVLKRHDKLGYVEARAYAAEAMYWLREVGERDFGVWTPLVNAIHALYKKVMNLARKWRYGNEYAQIEEFYAAYLRGDYYLDTVAERENLDHIVEALQAEDRPMFFSALEQHITGLSIKATTPANWKKEIAQKSNVKKEELEWTGILAFLDSLPQNERIPRETILEWAQANSAGVREVDLGRAFENYTTRAGTNYRVYGLVADPKKVDRSKELEDELNKLNLTIGEKEAKYRELGDEKHTLERLNDERRSNLENFVDEILDEATLGNEERVSTALSNVASQIVTYAKGQVGRPQDAFEEGYLKFVDKLGTLARMKAWRRTKEAKKYVTNALLEIGSLDDTVLQNYRGDLENLEARFTFRQPGDYKLAYIDYPWDAPIWKTADEYGHNYFVERFASVWDRTTRTANINDTDMAFYLEDLIKLAGRRIAVELYQDNYTDFINAYESYVNTEKRIAEIYATQDNLQRDIRDLQADIDRLERGRRPDRFTGGHFNVPNIQVHYRVSDLDKDNKHTLLVEEIQSDWASKYRAQQEREAREERPLSLAERGKIPQPLFTESSQYGLAAFKALLHRAVREGYTHISIVGGMEQVDRYRMAHFVNKIIIKDPGYTNHKIAIEYWPKDQSSPRTEDIAKTRKDLRNYIGRDLADKVWPEGQQEPKWGTTLEGEDLMVGDRGHIDLYDRIFRNSIDKYIKQWGASLQKDTIQKFGSGRDTPNLAIGRNRAIPNQIRDIDDLTFTVSPLSTQYEKLLSVKSKSTGAYNYGIFDFSKSDAEIFDMLNNLIYNVETDEAIMTTPITERDMLQVQVLDSDGQRVIRNIERGAPFAIWNIISENLTRHPIPPATKEVDVWTVEINDKMRNTVPNGMPLFAAKHSLNYAKKLGWFSKIFLDVDQIARNYPAMRPFWNTIRDQVAYRAKFFRENMDKLATLHKEPPESTAEMARYMAAVTEQNEHMGKKQKFGKSFTAEMDLPHLGIKKGDTISLTDAQVKHVTTLRDIGNGVIDEMKKILDTIPAEDEKTAQSKKEILATLDERRDRYMPLVRRTDFVIPVWKKGTKHEPKNLIGYYSVPPFTVLHSPRGLKRYNRKTIDLLVKKIKEWHPDGEVNEGMPEMQPTLNELNRDLGFANSVLASLERLATIEDERSASAAVKELLEATQLGGFKSHLKERRALPGYVHLMNADMYIGNAYPGYIAKASHWLSRAKYDRQMGRAMDTIKKSNVVGLGEYALSTKEYLDNPKEEFANARQISFLMMLGGNISSALVNLSQTFHTTLPYLGSLPGRAAQTSAAIMKYTPIWQKGMFSGAGGGKIYNVEKLKGRVDARLFDILKELEQEGVLEPLTTNEYIARDLISLGRVNQTVAKKAQEKIIFLSTFMFNSVELYNRYMAAMATWDTIKNKEARTELERRWRESRSTEEKPDPTDLDLLRFVVEETQFITTKENRPVFMRGILSVPTQFMSFPLRMVQLYVRMLASIYKGARGGKINKADALSFAYMTLSMLALGGIFGLPFGELLKDKAELINKIMTGYDVDLELKFREGARELFGAEGANILTRGVVPTLLGVDIAGRVGINPIDPNKLDGSLADFLGPFGSITIGNLEKAINRYYEGHSAIEVASAVAPLFLQNAISAAAAYKRGYDITEKGTPLATTPTRYEAFMRAIGFTPRELYAERQLNFQKNRLTQSVARLRERYTNQVVELTLKARFANGAERRRLVQELRALREEIRELNRDVDPEYRIRINQDTVRRRIREKLMAERGETNYGRLRADLRARLEEIRSGY